MQKAPEPKPKPKQSGWRGSEDLWLDAAYNLLVESGVASVKVMPLAKALNLSRTSFYWHFADRDALLDALIKRWERQNTGQLVAQTERYAQTINEAVLNLFDCWINPQLFDARMDFAIRNWAQQTPALKTLMEQNDRQRLTAIGEMFSRFGFTPQQSETRARTAYYTQVGYISMMVEEPMAERLKRIPDYVESLTASYPTDAEIARFMARHQTTDPLSAA
ncbi:TetR/AcrR family transcriptional regulator [Neptunomonas antarctica]|uniref:Transcriptional regulator, TetR family n=1 Tax=Neptunomonas antarctica TaxID=619304 RepID=A0A1N7MXN2_9GAMM|nr:TetR/AcrR family transcriptional regulator [Neptunomonas antarctica]SIS90855.1 transcriptional regulator, TetR family [Neptunomonas antarctica]